MLEHQGLAIGGLEAQIQGQRHEIDCLKALDNPQVQDTGHTTANIGFKAGYSRQGH
jgi:hypothetical protein